MSRTAEGIPATHVQDYDDLEGAPGSYQLTLGRPAYIIFSCPSGCGDLSSLPIVRKGEEAPKGRPSWDWDGNEEAPTLTPSVRKLDGCKWHGFLKAGRWVRA